MKIEIDEDWISITCDNCGETYNFKHKMVKENRAKKCSTCFKPYNTKKLKKVLDNRFFI